jgi:uncharacterized protein (TIRG00374 family)
MKRSSVSSFLRFLLFLSIGIILFYYVFSSQQEAYREQCMQNPVQAGKCSLWAKLLEDIKKLDRLLIFLVMLGFVISNIMRARRWVIMLRTMGIRAGLWETFWAVHLGYFANLALPRMGELARAGTLARRLHAPLEKILGTIISDRLLDLIVLGLFTGLGFFLQFRILYEFLSRKASISLWQLMVLGIAGLLVIAVFIFLFRTDRFYHPVIEKIKSKIQGLREGVVSVVKTGNPLEVTLLSVGIWIMYYSMTLLGLKAFAPTSGITALQGMIVFIIGSLGMIIPTPGGIGPYHFLTMSALGIYGISSIEGFSYANLSFIVVQVVTISLFGIIGMAVLSKTKKTKSLDSPLPT